MSRYLIGAFALLLCASCATKPRVAPDGLPPGAARLESPTGRTPKLWWTAERQAVWARMQADYQHNPQQPVTSGGRWFKGLKTTADCGCRYGDTGLYATLMYQITGDPQYVTKAWARLTTGFFAVPSASLGGSYAREYSAELVVLYDWLYPGLSEAQRATFLGKLNELFTVLVTGTPHTNPAMPIRPGDSDQTTGSYFGLVFLYLATGDHNPAAQDWFGRPWLGGLTATGRDRTTLRNAIAQYVTQLAAGGEWIESSEYNVGTVRLLVMGAEGVRTATGTDYFPEVTAFARAAALRQLYILTPDLKDSVQWGDEEHPHGLVGRLFSWQMTNGALAGLTAGDAASGPYVQQLVYDLTTQYGFSGYQSAEPWARFFVFFNPYAPKANYRTLLPRGWFAPGQGLLVARDAWTPASTLVSVHMPPQQPAVDHQVAYFGDFQMYRKGAWVVSHPLGYGGAASYGEGTNAMVLGSFSSMAEFKRVTAQEFGPRSEYAYIAGTTGGQKAAETSYDPPATFLHEWTRSVLYLPAADQQSDTLVVYDRTHAEAPATLPGFTRYSATGRNEQGAILTALALKQWIVHMPVAPAVDATGLRWATADGQQVQVRTLLPVGATAHVYDERTLWPGTAVPLAERKWQVRLVPPGAQAWDTFLNVVQVSDAGADLTSTLVTSDTGDAEGVQLHRGGLADTVVLFNATPGPKLAPPLRKSGRSVYQPATAAVLETVRLRTTGYTVTWYATSARTDLFLCDLAPDRAWQIRIDGAKPVPVAPSPNGLLRVDVERNGPHVIELLSDASTQPIHSTAAHLSSHAMENRDGTLVR